MLFAYGALPHLDPRVGFGAAGAFFNQSSVPLSMKSSLQQLGSCRLRLAAVACVVCFFATTAGAQAPKENAHAGASADGTQAGSQATQDPPEPAIPGDVVYLPGPNGRLVPVPADATLKEFLKWRESQRRNPDGAGPDFGVASIELEGRALDDRCELTATIGVQLNRDGRWVHVPLGLNEATLRKSAYEGHGDASPGGFSGETTGYRWWLKGRGMHRIVLTMIVPLRTQLPSHRLRLTLPRSPVSSLKLRVDAAAERLSVKGPENSALDTSPLGEDATQIEVFGLGTQLDLAWQRAPVPTQVKPVLQSTTQIRVELAGETVLLNARQRIQALSGSFGEVTVQLPAGFELSGVEGGEYSEHKVDAENRATIRLDAPTASPVELRWSMETAFPRSDLQLNLDGFDVAGAVQQSGEIAVGAFNGYRLSKRDGDSRFVYRINPDQLPDGIVAARAYRFRSQPFRLVLEFDEIEPEYTADSLLRLKLAADHAELDCRFAFEVFQGAVHEVALSWPQMRAQGWSIEPLSTSHVVERVNVENRDDVIRIALAELKTGRFDVRLKARREIPAVGEEFSLDLPSTGVPGTAILVLAKAENVKADLTAQGSTVALPISEERLQILDMPEELHELRFAQYNLDSEKRSFTTSVSVQKQLVEAESKATAELRNDRLLVSQQIDYEIAYERLAQVRLLVPGALQGRVDFRSEAGDELKPDWVSGFEGRGTTQARIALPDAKMGRFRLVARFVVDLQEGASPQEKRTVNVPLIRSADAEYARVRFEFQHDEQYEASVPGASWEPQFPVGDSAVWASKRAETEVPLILQRERFFAARGYSIRKALIRTALDREGFVRSRAQYRISGDASTVAFTLPATVAIEAIWWNDRLLAPEEIAEQPEEAGRYRLKPNDGVGDGDQLLSIDFRAKSPSPPGWSDVTEIDGPKFPDDVWLAQSMWQVVLPYDQHLFARPDGFTPQFRWRRETIFWSRQPIASYADLGRWIGDDGGPANRDELAIGNSYVFSRFGPTTELSLRSMSRSVVVLFGAGVSLALGFLLLRIPATRNVMTLLAGAFCLALMELWYKAPVQLLLQPAILGFVLAVGAALIESSLKRDRSSSVLTLSSPSDFVVTPPSAAPASAAPVAPADTNAPTAVRPPADAHEPVSTSDSGSSA